MNWNTLVDLIEITESTNYLGDVIENEATSTVYANKKAVKLSEFYQAAVIGLKPELVFEVRAVEYMGQEFLTHENKKYKIIRTYTKNDEIIELVVTGFSGAGL